MREGFQEAAGKRWDGCLRALLQVSGCRGGQGQVRGSIPWAYASNLRHKQPPSKAVNSLRL